MVVSVVVKGRWYGSSCISFQDLGGDMIMEIIKERLGAFDEILSIVRVENDNCHSPVVGCLAESRLG